MRLFSVSSLTPRAALLALDKLVALSTGHAVVNGNARAGLTPGLWRRLHRRGVAGPRLRVSAPCIGQSGAAGAADGTGDANALSGGLGLTPDEPARTARAANFCKIFGGLAVAANFESNLDGENRNPQSGLRPTRTPRLAGPGQTNNSVANFRRDGDNC